MHAKPVNYIQDGSGRDNYIIVNQGGFKNQDPRKEYRDRFKASLRGEARNDYYLQRRGYDISQPLGSPSKKMEIVNEEEFNNFLKSMTNNRPEEDFTGIMGSTHSSNMHQRHLSVD